MQNFIRQALAFNPDKEHVPGPKIPTDPKFKIGGEFGTTHYKQMYLDIYLINFILFIFFKKIKGKFYYKI